METKTKILIGLGVLTVGGVVGYIAYNKLKAKNEEENSDELMDKINSGATPTPDYKPDPKPRPSGSGSKPASTGFPLKLHSKGQLVRDVQTALNKHYGASIKIDGDYGSKTQAALEAKGLPTTISSQQFAMIIVGKANPESNKSSDEKSKDNKPAETNSKTIAKELHSAIEKDNIFGAVTALKKIKNKDKYLYVNEEFKKKKFLSLSYLGVPTTVSKTVVTALADQFENPEYKKKINAELYRIGLKYDGSKWALSGPPAPKLVMRRRGYVFTDDGRRFMAPKGTTLGQFVSVKNRIVRIDTNDDYQVFTDVRNVIIVETEVTSIQEP